jgi:hypothetical protein
VTVPLWRVEPDVGRPGERPPPERADWLHEALVASGAWDAMGRWFAADPSLLDWYAREHEVDPPVAWRVVRIDVDAASLEAWRVSAQAEAGRFSRDPANEFFVPRGVASGARRDPVVEAGVRGRLEAAAGPRHAAM